MRSTARYYLGAVRTIAKMGGLDLSGGRDTLKGLEGRADGEGGGGENNASPPREFFWDSLVLYMVYAIIALTAVEAIFEFVRDESGVQCLTPETLADNLQDFVNGLCSGSLPVTEYFTVFMFIHGLAIGIPHSLWLNIYAGSFSFFFKRASSLERLRSEKTGRYPESNDTIVEQLEAAFQTYGRNWIYGSYVLKLILQLLFAVASFVLGIVYFTEFTQIFDCPSTLNETLTNRAWPLPGEQIVCVFSTLRILELLRIVDLVLVAIVLLCLLLSLFWCASGHSMELGSDSVAVFSFQTGLDPHYYPTRLPFFGPRIKNDLDFMVMKLFRTDGGLGHVFKEVRVLKKIKALDVVDRLKLDLYYTLQLTGDDEDFSHNEKALQTDIKWTFGKPTHKPVYDTFTSLPLSAKLSVPDSLRGAVLGYAAKAPENKVAIYVSFGSRSSAMANCLARLFLTTVWFNFSPFSEETPADKKEPQKEEQKDEVKSKEKEEDPEVKVTVSKSSTGVITVTCKEDVLVTKKDRKKFIDEVLDIFMEGFRAKPEEYEGDPKEANFVLVGPVDSEERSAIVDKFFDLLMDSSRHFIADGALMLYLHPKIGLFKSPFLAYSPKPTCFQAVENNKVAVLKGQEPLWPPEDKRNEKGKKQQAGKYQRSKTSKLNKLFWNHPKASLLAGDRHHTFELALFVNSEDDDDAEDFSSKADNEGGSGGDNEGGAHLQTTVDVELHGVQPEDSKKKTAPANSDV